MSKYAKYLAQKAYRNQTRQVNKQAAEELKKVRALGLKDDRSTYDTFCQWCEECGDELYPDFYGVLSRAGSDGIEMDKTKIGGIPYCDVAAVDKMLEEDGYYEDEWVNVHSTFCLKPKMTYLEWFNQKFNK